MVIYCHDKQRENIRGNGTHVFVNAGKESPSTVGFTAHEGNCRTGNLILAPSLSNSCFSGTLFACKAKKDATKCRRYPKKIDFKIQNQVRVKQVKIYVLG